TLPVLALFRLSPHRTVATPSRRPVRGVCPGDGEWNCRSAALLRRMAMIHPPGDEVPRHLNQLHQHHQDDDGVEHDIAPESLVAVSDRQVAEAPGADGTRHGGIADEANGRDGHP